MIVCRVMVCDIAALVCYAQRVFPVVTKLAVNRRPQFAEQVLYFRRASRNASSAQAPAQEDYRYTGKGHKHKPKKDTINE